jgi:hypothetical protein
MSDFLGGGNVGLGPISAVTGSFAAPPQPAAASEVATHRAVQMVGIVRIVIVPVVE